MTPSAPAPTERTSCAAPLSGAAEADGEPDEVVSDVEPAEGDEPPEVAEGAAERVAVFCGEKTGQKAFVQNRIGMKRTTAWVSATEPVASPLLTVKKDAARSWRPVSSTYELTLCGAIGVSALLPIEHAIVA